MNRNYYQENFFSLVWKYLCNHKLKALLLFASAIMSAITIAISPKITEQLIQLTKTDINGLSSWGLTLSQVIYLQVGLIIIAIISTFISNYIGGNMGKDIEIDLRNRTAKKLLDLDVRYYSDKKIGDILTKVVSDTQIIGDQTGSIPILFINAIITLLVSMGVMFSVDWKLTLLIFATFGFVLILGLLLFPIVKKKNIKVREKISTLNGNVMDRINTIKLIKSNGSEEYEKIKFKEGHDEYYKVYTPLQYVQSFMLTILFIAITSIQVILIVFTILLYRNDSEKIILVLPSMIQAVGILIRPIMSFIRVMVGLSQASTSIKRTAEILRNESLIDKSGVQEIDSISEDIILSDIVFAYPEKPDQIIIPKLTIVLEKGKSYAFVGESGSGKSTIAKLLLRLYDPAEGEILINKINLKNIDSYNYLSHVGYVEQEPAIFIGNVFDNVGYGIENVTKEEIIEACKKAELHEVVMSWKKGYETILGERGFILSGGQKQRLVIARAFLKNPDLLILDEATSALDNIVEKEIQEKLNELMKGRTSVSIAHRLSTIKDVDQIIVLAPKRGIIQMGTFEELIKIKGHFKMLYEAGEFDKKIVKEA